MTASTSSSENLSERMRVFGLLWLGMAGLGITSHLVTTVLVGELADLVTPGTYLHLAMVFVPLATWGLCRGPRSERFCRMLESVALLFYVTLFALMVRMLAQLSIANLAGTAGASALAAEAIYSYFGVIIAFVAVITLGMRSAIVPSRPGRTALLGVGMGVAFVTMFVIGLPGDPPDRTWGTAGVAISISSLWMVGVGACTGLTAVIHGLRREIAKARQLGQYTLGEKLGEGGMGTVYRASHAMLRRPTAVKLLQEGRVSPDALKRFEREVQLTAQLTHPNTITIYDYGRTPDGVFYYAMELLEGATLQEIVDSEGPQPAARVVHVLRMIAGALTEAHERGLIHRDIKPANVVLSQRGGMRDVATVLDFGLVREINDNANPALTTAGAVVGTPMYLAPEVIASKEASAQSDLYALGGVGYFMLTGHTVFDADTVVEICGHHLHSPVTPPSQRLGTAAHPGLEALLVQCLAKDPLERPESAAFFAERLVALDVPAWVPPR